MSLPTVTVEIAFASDPDASSPKWQNVSAYFRSAHIRRGRERDTDQTRPGTCELTLNNPDRRFDPAYTQSPYYPNVVPQRRLRVSATWSGTTYFLFNGLVERWPMHWDLPSWGSVTLEAVDDMAALEAATISGTLPQEATGSRISRVLTAAGWPASTAAPGYWTLGTSQLGSTTILSYGIPTTVIDAGVSQVQTVTFADDGQQSALAHLQDVVGAERGMFFVDGQGRAIFFDRKRRYTATSQVTFAETSLSASRLPYQQMDDPEVSVDRLFNEVKVTRPGGTVQTASDGTSRQRYKRRTMALTPPLLTDTEAMNRAALEVKLRKDARLEFDTFAYQPISNDNSWPHALGRELGDRITVERAPSGIDAFTGLPVAAETITRGCFIESIDHNFSDVSWTTSYQLSPADGYDQFFKLGTAQLGSTTNALLAY